MEKFTGEIIRTAAAVQESMERRQHQQAGVYVSFQQRLKKPKMVSGYEGHAAAGSGILGIHGFYCYFTPVASGALSRAFNADPQLSLDRPDFYAGDALG